MLHVHRAERADRLADGLADAAGEPLDDPFTPEVVAVPTRGIERWLTQRLSTRLGTTRGPRRRDLRERRLPVPGPADRRRASRPRPGSIPTTTRGCRSARCGRCSRSSTSAWASRGWPRSRATWSGARGGPEDAAAALRRGPPYRRPVRPLRGPPPGHGARLGGRRADGRRARATAGRPSCGGGCARGSAGPSPAERLSGACERIRARARRSLDLPRAPRRCSG